MLDARLPCGREHPTDDTGDTICSHELIRLKRKSTMYLNPYTAIVEAQVRTSYRRISQGDVEQGVSQFASTFTYTFLGHHALSGTRHTKEAMRSFFDRAHRLIPDAAFLPQEIVVKGGPWNTVVIVRLKLRGTLADGSLYKNDAYQMMRLCWGRITDMETLEDTQRLVGYLTTMATVGITEAVAPPLVETENTSG